MIFFININFVCSGGWHKHKLFESEFKQLKSKLEKTTFSKSQTVAVTGWKYFVPGTFDVEINGEKVDYGEGFVASPEKFNKIVEEIEITLQKY